MATAQEITDYLNDLTAKDKQAMAALIANRVPCNQQLADHPTCVVKEQHGGYHIGLLGILNGLCSDGKRIMAVFDDAEGSDLGDLSGFAVRPW